MKTQLTEKPFNVYFHSPSEVELIQSFSSKEDAIDLANNPVGYWFRKLNADQTACMIVTNGITGEDIYQTLTEEEQNA